MSRSPERDNPPERDAAQSRREPDARLERERSDRSAAGDRDTLCEIGRFRTVAVQDLAHHRYGGASAQMQQHLRSLLAQGLVQRRTAVLNAGRELSVLVLTKAGKRLAEHEHQGSAQIYYAGFVKPAEVAHDAAIYRMFHKEAERIESQGGRVRRVVLDYELKRKVYAPLAKARHAGTPDYAKCQEQVARENGLKVIKGKIPLPDLRIEYDTAQGARCHIDLELATHHYHGSHLQTKAEAGFKMYAESGSVRTPVFEDREITADILSL